MKIRLSLFCIALAIIACNVADAQRLQGLHHGAAAQSAFRPVAGDLFQPRAGGMPGRLWFEANVSDHNLGSNGTYLTLGGKTRIGEDRFDGRWLMEGQVHYAVNENGGAFANIGIERVFSIPAAKADFSFGVWYDYNGDRQTNFSHTFHQVGLSAKFKKENVDLLINGYLPTGTQDNIYGDPSGINCFVGNDIVIMPGIDSALQGFDVTLRTRPKQLAFVNGFIDVGGYSYNSDLIDSFGGGKIRLGFQGLGGMMVNMEINQDERFNTSGVLGVGWAVGANGSGYGSEYSPLGRDLESTVRNDHIVVFNQSVVFAFDPLTGAPYNVIHVLNTADPTVGIGTVERPYNSLVTAQTLSAPGDVILVNAGDGTDRNMRNGIILQDNQRLWGNGQALLIPIQNGQFFQLCTNPGGITPTISNNGGFAVVQLANNNDVAGINIDATGAMFGIWGNGNTTSIRNNTVSNANADGVYLSGVTGDVTIANNTFSDNGRNGLFLLNALDTTANILVESNVATRNMMDGIQMRNYDPASIRMLTNTTDANIRNGLMMENYINSTGGDVLIRGHRSNLNVLNGIHMNRGLGNLDILNSRVTNNGSSIGGSGVFLENWRTVDPDRINIGTTPGGFSTFTGNGAYANLDVLMNEDGIHARVNVFDTNLSDGIRGLAARVEGVTGTGVRTTLDIDVIDILEINRNVNEAITIQANDSGLIRARIGKTTGTAPLELLDNARGGGSAIAIVALGVNGQPQAEIQAEINNVTINNAISRIVRPGLPDLAVSTVGINIDSNGNGLVDVDVTNVTIGAPNLGGAFDRDTQIGILINLDNNGSDLINRITIDNATLFSDFGVALFTGDDTYTDFTLGNSTIMPNGIPTVGGRSDNTPFGDGIGTTGVLIQTVGRGTLTGNVNWNAFGYFAIGAATPTNIEIGIFETISDGDLDNLTQVTMFNNTIQDFTFEGVDIETFGDSQMLLSMVGNNITNNGAGFNDDNDNDNVFGEQAADGGGIADPNQLFFFDGVNINAFDESQISANILGNVFLDNFERGLSLNTFNSATINVYMENNTFFGNDRGTDADVTLPPTIVGGGTPAIGTAGFADFEAINNEEFHSRIYETLVLIAGDNGNLIDLTGTDLAAPDIIGRSVIFSLMDNVGFDLFGPIAFGTANMNLSMSNNAFQLGPEMIDYSVPGGEFGLGLDGLTNGFVPGTFAPFGVSDVGFAAAITLIGNEAAFFGVEGF